MTDTNYLRDRIINGWFRNTAYTMPTTVYAALFTTMPTDANGTGLVEVVGGSYARQAVTFTAPSSGVSSNSLALLFPALAACTVLGGGVYDAVSGGNLLTYNRLPNPAFVPAGRDYVVPVAYLILTRR